MVRSTLFSGLRRCLPVLLTLALTLPAARAADIAQTQAVALEILRDLVGAEATPTHGTIKAATLIRDRALAAGFAPGDVALLAPTQRPNRANVVVRLRGQGTGRPILFITHLDVVETGDQPWTVPPHQLTEKDGFYYGRGTLDIQGEAAIVLANLIALKQQGYRPDHDIIAAFTADEEAGDANGVDWLLKAHRDKVDAGLVINPDEGSPGMRDGKPVYYGVQTSTKRYVTFVARAEAPGGHSALPRPDNAIITLSAALARLADHRFPTRLSETTRGYFRGLAEQQTGQKRADLLSLAGPSPDPAAIERLSADVERNAVLRTTCVPTLLKAGTVENALPTSAEATIQCRLLPGDDPARVADALRAVMATPAVKLTMTEAGHANPELAPPAGMVERVRKVVQAQWPGVPVLTTLNIGASDSSYTRAAGITTLGLGSIFYDLEDDRMHGPDERVEAKRFQEGVEFMGRLMKELAGD